jgi:hypothetical protein
MDEPENGAEMDLNLFVDIFKHMAVKQLHSFPEAALALGATCTVFHTALAEPGVWEQMTTERWTWKGFHNPTNTPLDIYQNLHLSRAHTEKMYRRVTILPQLVLPGPPLPNPDGSELTLLDLREGGLLAGCHHVEKSVPGQGHWREWDFHLYQKTEDGQVIKLPVHSLGEAKQILASFVSGSGIYLYDGETLFLLEKDTGKLVWRKELCRYGMDGFYFFPLEGSRDTIFVAWCAISDSGVIVVRFNESGIIWKSRLPSAGVSHSRYTHSVVVYTNEEIFVDSDGSYAQQSFSVDPETGTYQEIK